EKAESEAKDKEAEKTSKSKSKDAAEEARGRSKNGEGVKEDAESKNEKEDNKAEREGVGLKKISLKKGSKDEDDSKETENSRDGEKVNTDKIEKPAKENKKPQNSEDTQLIDEIQALIGKQQKDSGEVTAKDVTDEVEKSKEGNNDKIDTDKIDTRKIKPEENRTSHADLKEMQFISAEAAEAAEAAAKAENSARAVEESQGAKVKTAALQKGSEDGASKEAKAASSDSTHGKTFTIVDLRTDKESKTEKRLSAIRNGLAGKNESGEAKTADGLRETGQGKTGRQIPLELKEELLKSNNIARGGNSASGESSDSSDEKVQVLRADISSQTRGKAEAQNAQNARFESPLLKHLKEELNGQIVKKSGIVLKDNGNGEIRLNLKPEHLGSIRIRLSLEDNHIAGKIYVENSSMREVFEQNMQNLQRQFEENGYESASLEVSVGDGKNQPGENRNSGPGQNGNSKAIQTLEEHIPEAVDSWHSTQLVDLMV
ncbi:MAG: flagellar hook-length control protein FliK, partial [Spirochaetaceae bacterium]